MISDSDNWYLWKDIPELVHRRCHAHHTHVDENVDMVHTGDDTIVVNCKMRSNKVSRNTAGSHIIYTQCL